MKTIVLMDHGFVKINYANICKVISLMLAYTKYSVSMIYISNYSNSIFFPIMFTEESHLYHLPTEFQFRGIRRSSTNSKLPERKKLWFVVQSLNQMHTARSLNYSAYICSEIITFRDLTSCGCHILVKRVSRLVVATEMLVGNGSSK